MKTLEAILERTPPEAVFSIDIDSGRDAVSTLLLRFLEVKGWGGGDEHDSRFRRSF
ncbi:unnamed protein product, partial [Amoebophrya sp. A25]|eukprot:GSA25T00004751001.1